ncbi:putative copia-type protein, partial [Trifolium pratense]
MDVTFVESEYFYSSSPISNSPLQGELQDEDQNWVNLPPFEADTMSEEMRPDAPALEYVESDLMMIDEEQNKGNDSSTIQVVEPEVETENESNHEPPYSLVHNGPSPENYPEVSISNPFPCTNDLDTYVGYKLPYRENCGKPPKRYSPDLENKRSKYPIANYVSTQRLSEPLKSFVHTLSSCHVPSGIQEALTDPKWVQAIKEEMNALQKNNTWCLVSLPKGKKTVGCRWVFSVKHKADGSIERYKARLVARGYTQTYGVDYQETFSPVAKLNTVRVLLSLAVNLDWPLHQFDVKNAFLYGDLEEEVYMDIPPGYNTSSKAEVVSGMLDCKPVDTPIVQNHNLGKCTTHIPANKERYQKLVGKLIYLSHTRPDIAYAVSIVSQFMHCPSEEHMDAVIRILRYLKSSPGKGLIFSKNNHLNIDGYTDADWAGDAHDRRSTSGYFTFVG